MKNVLRSLSLVLCALVLLSCVACSAAPAAPAQTKVPDATAAPASGSAAPASEAPVESKGINAADLKVALILNGSITDASWNANGYNALVSAKEKLGFQFAYIENVQTADMEATFRDYAEQGYQLILGHGSQFEDSVMAVAPSYPQTYFFVFNGEVANGVNACSFRTATDENTFVSGALAALMSKTGTIGWIGAMEVPTTSEALDGYAAGAAYAKPEVKVLSAYVGSYNDAAKAKELALTMFESKADIIQSNANQGTAGIIEAAKNFGNNVMLIGNTTDQYELAPELFLTSNITNFSAVYSIVIMNVIDGTFDPVVKAVGMKEGCMDIAPYHNFDSVVPAEVKTKIEQIKQDIAAGKLNDVLPAEYPGREKSK